MAADIQTGTATVFGVANDGTAIAISGYATFLIQGAKPTHKFDLAEVKDASGFDANLIATNGRVELDLDFIPSGATRAAAATVTAFLSPLATVTTTHFKVSALNGTWIYIGDETIDLGNTASSKMTLKVRKYDDSTQNTSLATVVSG